MVIIRTSAVEVSIQAVSPVSSFGAAAAAAGAASAAAGAAVCAKRAVGYNQADGQCGERDQPRTGNLVQRHGLNSCPYVCAGY